MTHANGVVTNYIYDAASQLLTFGHQYISQAVTDQGYGGTEVAAFLRCHWSNVSPEWQKELDNEGKSFLTRSWILRLMRSRFVARFELSMFTVEMKELAEWFGLELCRLTVDECLAKHEKKIGLENSLQMKVTENTIQSCD